LATILKMNEFIKVCQEALIFFTKDKPFFPP
jgi:hypothetical protein